MKKLNFYTQLSSYFGFIKYSFVILLMLFTFPSIAAVQTPVFIDGLAQPVYQPNKSIITDYYINTKQDTNFDGVMDRTHVVVVRPKETDSGLKMPAIIFPLPYYASTGNNNKAYLNTIYNVDVDSLYDASPGFNNVSELKYFDNNRSANNSTLQSAKNETGRMLQTVRDYFLARGFIIIYAESVGTGNSTGCPSLSAPSEGIAIEAVVDWLNNRAHGYDTKGNEVIPIWSNGKAGAIGISYGGTLTGQLATTAVNGLLVNIPISMVSNFYDYYRANGMVRACGGCQGEDMISLYQYIINQAYTAICMPVQQNIVDSQDRITGDYNSFWVEHNLLNQAKVGMTPTLIVHGLNDENVKLSQSINWYSKLKSLGVPVKLALHQGVHQNPATLFGSDMWYTLLNRWMSQYLYGQNNHVQDDPTLIQREDKSIGTYIDYTDPNAINTTYRFVSNPNATDGKLGDTPVSSTAKLVDNAAITLASLISTTGSPNRLIYKTDALVSAKRMSGSPVLNLNLAINQPNPNPQALTAAANVSAALVDFKPDGTYYIVTRGWADPQNHLNISVTTFLQANNYYPLIFTMEPDDYVFGVGSKIGIVLYSSDNEFTLRPKAGTELSFDLNLSNVVLPLVSN